MIRVLRGSQYSKLGGLLGISTLGPSRGKMSSPTTQNVSDLFDEFRKSQILDLKVIIVLWTDRIYNSP